MIFLALIACSAFFQDEPVLEDRGSLRDSLTGNFRKGSADLRPFGEPFRAIDATVQPVRFSLFPNFEVSAALWTPDTGSDVGIVVTQGHYGQGKSGAEAQEVAHRLAAQGAYVLAVDTPGVEEWAVPGRQIHFDEGAHNRGILVSRGTSVLALQIDILRRGVDVLESVGAKRIGVTGASGGAVQAFYLGWVDERVETAVMASFPRIPREAAASGCPCDHIPGHPGPDPHLLGQWQSKTLWISDVEQARPQGLTSDAEFVVESGPHSYTASMQRRAVDWFEDHLGLRDGPWLQQVPNFDLSTGPIDPNPLAIADLPPKTVMDWVPTTQDGVLAMLSCEGEGATILGLGQVDSGPLVEAGWQVCSVDVPSTRAAWTESIGRGQVYADVLAGAVARAVRERDAKAIWAHRAWGLVASAQNVPFVVHEPIRSLGDLRPDDPPWIHVPGAWDGTLGQRMSRAHAVHTEPEPLMQALKSVVSQSRNPAY